MQNLIQQTEQWAQDRNLIHGSTPQKQFLKLAEELGELFSGHNKNNLELIKDSVGDCFVVLTILSKQLDFDSLENEVLEGFECYGLPREMYKEGANENLRAILKAQGELADLLLGEEMGDDFEIFQAIGSMTYNLVHYSYGQGLDFRDCVQHAYDQIKDRKGKMINGVFVKEGDL